MRFISSYRRHAERRPARRRSSRRVIQVPRDLDRCRHGHELEDTATEELGGGWIVWGRYACDNCGRVGLDHVQEPPDVILVGRRRMTPRRIGAVSLVPDGGS
jgi:hypothetical protein